MTKKGKGQVRSTKWTALPEEERLDEMNAVTLGRKSAPEVIRRRMEAQIETKAKRRRSREAPASSAWKKPV